MKINKLTAIIFSLVFSSVGMLGSGCYYNAKNSNPQPLPPPNLAEEQSQSQNTAIKNNTDDIIISKTNNDKSNSDDTAPKKTTTNKDNNSVNIKNESKVEKNNTNTDNKNKKDSNDISKSINNPKTSNNNDNKIKGQNILPLAKKYSTPVSEVLKMIKKPSLATHKIVFLTFDDGPNIYKTPQILNILKENNVHATFFVLGSNLQNKTNKNIVMQAYKNGNAIANHSYSHNLKVIYPKNSVSVSTFMNEVNQTNSILKEILGPNFNCKVVRMPGGYNSRVYYNDPNLNKLNKTLNNNGITLIDWNALSGDAVPGHKTASDLLNNVKKQSKNKKVVVLLMHDIHNISVEALPSIIQYYKDNGYEFRVISN